MKRLLIIILTVIVLSVLMLGCKSKSEEGEVILLGAINSMTGLEAMVGNEHRWAYQQAVDDINAEGGVYIKDLDKKLKFKLIVVDDKSTVDGTAAAAEKLIKLEKVDFVLGTVSSPQNIAGGAVAEKYKKLYISTTFFTEMFAEQKFKWVVDSFFSIMNLASSSAGCLDAIPKAQRPKNFCVLVGDNPDGHGFGGGAKATLKKFGYHLALYEPFVEGSKDFSSSILRMKAAKADALITLMNSTDAMTLVRQLKENNFNLKYIWGAKGFWPIEFGETLGKDADYIVSDGHWAEALDAPGSKALGEKYRDEFGSTKYSVTIGNFYSLVQHLAQAIEAAGSIDNTKVRDVYYSGKFVAKDTVEGDLAFNKDGVAEFPAVALQWMGGKRMPVWPITPKVWTLKLIPPWDKR